MAASSRWTSHPTVVVDCPRCARPLPPITVDCDARASGLRMLSLTVTVRELDEPWWAVARAEHRRCLPPHVQPRAVVVPGGVGVDVIEG